MIGLLGIALLFAQVADESEPKNISGNWVSPDWGIVTLSMSDPGRYRGTFADGMKQVSGSFDLQWSQEDRRFAGRWEADDNCSGRISLRAVDDALEGAWTSNKAARRKLGVPELSEFSWSVADSVPATDQHKPDTPGSEEAEWLAATENVQVGFGGKAIASWLEEFEKSTVTETENFDADSKAITSYEAIKYFRTKPQYDAEIRGQMTKWVSFAEQTTHRAQLKRLARAIVRISGPRHQNQAIDHLNRIAAKHPEASLRKFFETYSADDSILTEPLSILELNTELATRASKTLSEGNSDQRLTMVILFFGFQRNANDITFWTQKNSAILIPALLVASHDENELVRRYSLNYSAQLSNPRIATRLIEVAETDSVSANRSCACQLLLHQQEFTPEVLACVTRVIESDLEFDVKAEALVHLQLSHPDNELIHATLMKWAHSNDTQMMQTVIQLMQQHPAKLQRPVAIDEIMELLSDPEWAMQARINLHSLNDHFDCVRQYAIAVLGSFEHHAVRALPVLEKETNPATARFARSAIDSIQGYCSDLPVELLQGKWRFSDGVFPDNRQSFLPLASGDEPSKPAILEVAGTELRIGGECVGYLSQARSNPEETLCVLLDQDSRQQRLTCSVQFADESVPAKRRSFSLRLIDKPQGFQPEHREELYRFRRVKKQ